MLSHFSPDDLTADLRRAANMAMRRRPQARAVTCDPAILDTVFALATGAALVTTIFGLLAQ
jgi:hypothetical protein